MKVAVLASGLLRGEWRKNLENFKTFFGDVDLFTAGWDREDLKQEDREFVDHTFEEPEVLYHPVQDTEPYPTGKCKGYKDNRILHDKTQHAHKQIMIHDYLLNAVDPDCNYDLIIRARFDCWLSRKVDFRPWMERSLADNCAIGFGCRPGRHKNLDVFAELPHYYPPQPNEKDHPDYGRSEKTKYELAKTQDWAYNLMDPLIFHPRKLWDTELVNRLFNEKQLKCAEWGWFQVLSEPYGESHLCVYGGAQIERHVGREKLNNP